MKRKLIFLILILAGLVLAATESPYARRIRPVTGGFPVSCIENEIAYDMTSHVFAICDNSLTYKALTTSGGSLNGSNLKLNGSVSGVLTITAPATFTNYSLTFPIDDGTSGQYLQTDGNGVLSWQTVTSGVTSVFGRTGVVVAANNDYTFAQLASKPTTFSGYGLVDNSAGLRGILSDENGSGAALFDSSTSATFITPILGTPTSITLTNATGLPVAGISNLGTNVGTFLITPSSANLITAVTDETGSGSLVFGTAPTITLANGTGLPISTGVSGLGTGVATFLATPSGANLASALTTALPISKGGTNCTAATITCFNNITAFTAAGTTGTTSTNLVFSTSPTLVTPVLGAASYTTLVGGIITITSNSAAAFTVGLNGSANPAFTVDASTASSATGIKIKSAAAAGDVVISPTSSGSNEYLLLQGLGTGTPCFGSKWPNGVCWFSSTTSLVIPSGATIVGASNGQTILGNSFLKWSDPTSPDTGLYRNAAGVIEINNGTAGTFRDLKLRNINLTGTMQANGVTIFSAGTPSISGNGTLDTGSNDSAGKISVNNTGASTITITFSVAWTRAPSCQVQNETTANLARPTSTTTQVVFAGTTVTGDKFAYVCMGY